MASTGELDVLLRLLFAAVLGAIIGFEREYRGHDAGLRTMSAVAIGSALYSAIGTLVAHTDPTRIAAQVVTGIGFLGAGSILRSGTSIKGLTTAAAIWVVAAMGMAAGFGYYVIATGTTLLIVVMLVALRFVHERWLRDLPAADEHELR